MESTQEQAKADNSNKSIRLEILANCSLKGGVVIRDDPDNPWYQSAESLVERKLLEKKDLRYTLTGRGEKIVDRTLKYLSGLID